MRCLLCGGDEENRTPDPLLARQVLSQLSYTPIGRVPTSFLKVPGYILQLRGSRPCVFTHLSPACLRRRLRSLQNRTTFCFYSFTNSLASFYSLERR